MLLKLFRRIRRAISIVLNFNVQIARLHERLDSIAINQGRILNALHRGNPSPDLRDYEYQIFSQWGEDGIIQHLIETVKIKNKTFIEFGVEDFFESNCRYLLVKENWRGFVIDGSSSHIERLKRSYFYWKYALHAEAAFISKDNINELLKRSHFEEDLGILSIDIDGNDYYVLEAINGFRPRILICEYNGVFGIQRKISIPYEADFNRTRKSHTNLYFGASLSAMTFLATRKGYTLVGTNRVGSNAFFVRNDLLNSKLQPLTAEQAFSPLLIRESRDTEGNFSFLAGEERLNTIRGMPVYNVESGILEML